MIPSPQKGQNVTVRELNMFPTSTHSCPNNKEASWRGEVWLRFAKNRLCGSRQNRCHGNSGTQSHGAFSGQSE
jgi:hypothetical protein